MLAGRRVPDPQRRPLAEGVVEQDGEVVLARDADPWADPVLVLRAAGAAARADLPLAPHALDRLATESAPLPSPWPADGPRTRSSTCWPPAAARSRCWRRWTRPACWCG